MLLMSGCPTFLYPNFTHFFFLMLLNSGEIVYHETASTDHNVERDRSRKTDYKVSFILFMIIPAAATGRG